MQGMGWVYLCLCSPDQWYWRVQPRSRTAIEVDNARFTFFDNALTWHSHIMSAKPLRKRDFSLSLSLSLSFYKWCVCEYEDWWAAWKWVCVCTACVPLQRIRPAFKKLCTIAESRCGVIFFVTRTNRRMQGCDRPKYVNHYVQIEENNFKTPPICIVISGRFVSLE